MKNNYNINKKADVSLKEIERNTISYINPEIDNKNKDKIFVLNELYTRISLPNNLTIQNNNDEYKHKIISVKDNNFFNQIIDDGIIKNKKVSVYKKLNITNNKSEQNNSIIKENEENLKKIDINNKKNPINLNNIDDEYKYNTNNYTQNQSIYYNKNKLYNKSSPKINTVKDLYNKNKVLNIHIKENKSTISSKPSYTDFNIANLSSIKKSENIINPIKKNKIVSSSKRRLSISFNRDIINKEKKLNENLTLDNMSINNDLNSNNIFLYPDNFYYKKNNYSLLNSKYGNNTMNNEDNEDNDKNPIKNIQTFNHLKTEIYNLDSKSQNIALNNEFLYNSINIDKNNFKGKKLYIKPLRLNSKSKNKNKEENQTNERLYRKKYSLNNLVSKPIKIKNPKESFNQENSNIKNINEIKIYYKNKLNLTNKKNLRNNNINANIKIDEYLNRKENNENLEYNNIDKMDNHCFYRKLYNYYTRMPLKKMCFIEKIKINNKNINPFYKNKIKYYSSFNTNKNKKIKLENIRFNGKNIISEKKVGKNILDKKKDNGSYNLINSNSNLLQKVKSYNIESNNNDLYINNMNNIIK